MTEYKIFSHVAVGILQAGIVWYGIRAMHRMGTQRAREQDQRHTGSMRALESLMERTARA